MSRSALTLALCLLGGCGPAGRPPGVDITSIWKSADAPRREALRKQEARPAPGEDDLTSIWKTPGASRRGDAWAVRDQQPLAIYLSILPPEGVGKGGHVFEVVVRNNTERTLFLDRRCLWPPLAMEAKLTSGERLSGVLPPPPTRVFAEDYVVSLRSHRDIRFGFAPDEFLTSYRDMARPEEGKWLDPEALVFITFRYSIGSLVRVAPVGEEAEKYPRDKGVWVHDTSSNILLMKASRLLELYRASLKARSMSLDSHLRYWHF